MPVTIAIAVTVIAAISLGFVPGGRTSQYAAQVVLHQGHADGGGAESEIENIDRKQAHSMASSIQDHTVSNFEKRSEIPQYVETGAR